MRRYLRIDGKALRGAAPRGGRAPMLPSEIWDDGTTAAQLPVNVKKTNEIPVFRDLLKKVPDLAGAVISADEMHTQRRHARDIHAAGAFYIFTPNRWETPRAHVSITLCESPTENWGTQGGQAGCDVDLGSTSRPDQRTHMADIRVIVRHQDRGAQRLDHLHDQALCG
jgi:hypothetical protein